MTEIPSGLIHVWSVMIGLIIGSFLNVIIYRLPHGRSVVRPGSQCQKCKKAIQWWDNIPVLSFLILRGKCRNCKGPISVQYPVIEALTALLFLACEVRFGLDWALIFRHWPLMAFGITIAFIDLQHRIIPDELSLGGLALGLATAWMVISGTVLGTSPWLSAIISSFAGAGIGFASFYGLAWIYERIRGKTGLGGGDVKLLAMIGAYVGPMGVLSTVFLSSILGSLVGIAWALAVRKDQEQRKLMDFSIPFGPFLIVGGLYYYLLGGILWFQFMIPT